MREVAKHVMKKEKEKRKKSRQDPLMTVISFSYHIISDMMALIELHVPEGLSIYQHFRPVCSKEIKKLIQ